MTEYDFSPQAYERYQATQNRIANWVDKTEQHRGEFQSADAGPPPDLTRSGPGPSSHSKLPHPRHGQPKPPVIHTPPSESDSSSSEGYYEGPWPHQPMVLPPMQQQPPMMAPPFVTAPHRVSHHHRHRSHDRRRSRSHHSPTYYSVASPPLSPGYQYTYPGANQGYVMMPQYSGSQMPVMVCPFFTYYPFYKFPVPFPFCLTLSFIFLNTVSPILLKYCLIFVHISLFDLSVEFLSRFSFGSSKCNRVHHPNNSVILSPTSTQLRVPRL